MTENLLTVGWLELIALPQLQVPAMKVKVDTGARTSALHATNIERFERQGEEYARFLVHPIRRYQKHAVVAEAPVIGEIEVKNSGGYVEKRPVVVTELTIGEETWPIQITLTNRENMRFKMLLGREAMREKLVVNPSVEYLHGKRSHKSMMSIYGCPYIPRTES
ncbi:MAG: hypothetical protein ACI9J2_000007 [Saprospiraceae bacterium]|jgi:hypothetical protein